MDSSTPGFPVHHQPPEPPQTHVHRAGDAIYLILCCPLLLLPSIFPSIRVFSSELALHIRCPKYWSFSFSTSPFNEYSGLIFFRINWFDLQSKGLQESSPTLQLKSINSLVLSFFMIQLLHPHMTTGKTRALTRQTFVGTVMSLLFNMLSRFVIAFLPRSTVQPKKMASWAIRSSRTADITQ